MQVTQYAYIGVSFMARKPFTPQTPFQTWFHTAFKRRGVGLRQFASILGADYSHLWKIVRGEPGKYPNSHRPGYELTLTIGKELGDMEGALAAAGFTSPQELRLTDMELSLVLRLRQQPDKLPAVLVLVGEKEQEFQTLLELRGDTSLTQSVPALSRQIPRREIPGIRR